LEALSLLPLWFSQPPYTNASRLDLLVKLHGGKSSLIYGYSGTAALIYKIKEKTWTLTVKGTENPELNIEGVDSGAMQSNPVLNVARVFNMVGHPEASFEMNKMVFFIPNDTSFMGTLFSMLGDEANRYMVLKTGANVRVAEELINKCVDDRYSEVFFAPELSARKERGEGKSLLYVKVRDLGDGIEKTVLLALWLEALNPSLILWDDFEGSAHPTLIKLLLEWLSKKPWQVILSTHSLDVLTSLLEVRPKNAKVIQLKKTNGDVLLHEDLTLEELENVIETSQDPRKLADSLKL
jgi:hypothetical protein